MDNENVIFIKQKENFEKGFAGYARLPRITWEVEVRANGRKYGLSNLPTRDMAISVGNHSLYAISVVGTQKYEEAVEGRGLFAARNLPDEPKTVLYPVKVL